MGSRSTPAAERCARGLAAALVAAALSLPAIAHARWAPEAPRFPVDRRYFQAMTGEVLAFSIGAAVALFGVIVLWYLRAPRLVDALTPVTPSAQVREARRHPAVRAARALVRFALDAPADGAVMRRCRLVAEHVFARIPAAALALGAVEGWLVTPRHPLPEGGLGAALRGVEALLAVWAASGLLVRELGGVLFAVFGYLCVTHGVRGADALPLVASAFFYVLHQSGRPVSVRQLVGVRMSLGAYLVLLGLVDKIHDAELFIAVGDRHPELLALPQAIFPALTREAWSFTTGLGEIVFGLLLCCGVFNRITTLALTLVFASSIFVLGRAAIVQVHPLVGFVLLFFQATRGASLDGLVFRTNVRLWSWSRRVGARALHRGAVTSIALAIAAAMLVPLVLVTEVLPVLAGTRVPEGYEPPPRPPPASEWPPIGTPASAPLPLESSSAAPPSASASAAASAIAKPPAKARGKRK